LFLKEISTWKCNQANAKKREAVFIVSCGYPTATTATTASMPAAPVHADHPPWDPVKLSSRKAIPDIIEGHWMLDVEFLGATSFWHIYVQKIW